MVRPCLTSGPWSTRTTTCGTSTTAPQPWLDEAGHEPIRRSFGIDDLRTAATRPVAGRRLGTTVHVMVPPEGEPEPPAFAEYCSVPAPVPVGTPGRFEFYDAARSPDLGPAVVTA
ncbi:hypothetical protein [Streptomyces shenzhenensis]|uniref:hypothetical protein n=1 Tax=Streptomyces shenzhenensis TaxID=943815 RepID=UPI00215D62C1|nr:hypothetical protein [Streptomyces shenzhenensis]